MWMFYETPVTSLDWHLLLQPAASICEASGIFSFMLHNHSVRVKPHENWINLGKKKTSQWVFLARECFGFIATTLWSVCHHRWTRTRKMYPLSPKEFWTGGKAGREFILVTAGGAWKAVSSNIVRLRINSHMQDAGIGMQNLEPTQSGEQQRLLWSAGDVTFATVLSEIHWFRDCTSAEYSWSHA